VKEEVMSAPMACTDCLRRAWLLRSLSTHIEQITRGAEHPSLDELLTFGDADLARAVAPDVHEQILGRIAALGDAWFADALSTAGCWAVCRHTDDHPEGLHDLGDHQGAIIGLGRLDAVRALVPEEAATIVGTSRPTDYGLGAVQHLGGGMAAAELTLVSSLSPGIDAEAHRSALAGGARTVAVVGCGPDQAIPRPGDPLWRKLVENGAIVSELPPGTSTFAWRGRASAGLLAALSAITVVVEADDDDRSMDVAWEAGFFEKQVGAVPGPITSPRSAGPNRILAEMEGAYAIRGAYDMLRTIFRG
jgi:DNA processing protein